MRSRRLVFILALRFLFPALERLRIRSAKARPRILVIDDIVPDCLIGAGMPRALQVLRALVQAGASVTHYSTLLRPDGSISNLSPVPGIRYLQRRGRGMAALATYLKEVHASFDAIIVSRRHNLVAFNEAADRYPAIRSSARLVFDSEAVFAAREALQRRVMNLTPGAGDFTVETEAALARHADIVIAVNEIDAEAYRAAGCREVVILGHAIVPAFDPAPHAARRSFIFVGPAYADDTPNGDSLIWFADRVLPILRHAIKPDLRLVHIGAVTAPAIKARGRWALDLRGPVADLAADFRHARVFVAPTRYASGIPLKVCEAAAYGVPCVVTPLLARQLGWVHDREALVAETSEDFARQCLRLYDDTELWERIRSAAFDRVKTDHAMPLFDRTVTDICARLLAGRSANGPVTASRITAAPGHAD